MPLDDNTIDSVCPALSLERAGDQRDTGHVPVMVKKTNVPANIVGSMFIFDALHDSHLCVNCGCVYYVKREG